MSWSIFKKLKLGEERPTIVTLQLANRSLTHPRGIIEDVLVKVDKFIFLADFIILDMQEDKEVPIILGRLFLATGRAMIGVQKGELRLRVQEEDRDCTTEASDKDLKLCCDIIFLCHDKETNLGKNSRNPQSN